jgi:uncharacterized membrane protein YeaQ/YmgE (transglycosylase-associated protein family)
MGQRTTLENAMNLVIWLFVGGILGWVASLIMRTDAQQGLFLNVLVGVVGAMLGGWLISPLLGVGTINQSQFSLGALSVSGFLERKKAFEGSLLDVSRLSPANAYRPVAGATAETVGEACAKELEDEILSSPDMAPKRLEVLTRRMEDQKERRNLSFDFLNEMSQSAVDLAKKLEPIARVDFDTLLKAAREE